MNRLLLSSCGVLAEMTAFDVSSTTRPLVWCVAGLAIACSIWLADVKRFADQLVDFDRE